MQLRMTKRHLVFITVVRNKTIVPAASKEKRFIEIICLFLFHQWFLSNKDLLLSTVKIRFYKIENVLHSVAKEKGNRSITTTSAIFVVEVKSHCPNSSHMAQDRRQFKPLIPRTSIIAANKRGKNFQELLTRAGPYNIKSDLIHLKVMVLKNVAKDAIHVTTLLMKPPMLYLNQRDGNSDKKRQYVHNKKNIFDSLHKILGTKNGLYNVLETPPIKL